MRSYITIFDEDNKRIGFADLPTRVKEKFEFDNSLFNKTNIRILTLILALIIFVALAALNAVKFYINKLNYDKLLSDIENAPPGSTAEIPGINESFEETSPYARDVELARLSELSAGYLAETEKSTYKEAANRQNPENRANK